MAKTHVAFAASLTFLPFILIPELSESFSKIEVAIIAGGVFIGSLFPDIDEPNSTISRSTIFTLLFSWILILSGNKHRGITHKFLFTLFFLLVAFTLDISNSVSEKYYPLRLRSNIWNTCTSTRRHDERRWKKQRRYIQLLLSIVYSKRHNKVSAIFYALQNQWPQRTSLLDSLYSL